MQSVRIYEMPACKMVSSGTGMFGEGIFNGYLRKNAACFQKIFYIGQARALFGCICMKME